MRLDFTNLIVGTNYQLQVSQSGTWANVGSTFMAMQAFARNMWMGLDNGLLYRLAVMPMPSAATATPQLADGFVVGATVTSGGADYGAAPSLQIVGGGGSGAQATATVSGGMVTSINITDAGFGYTTTPTIQIDPPTRWFRLCCQTITTTRFGWITLV